VRKIFRRQAKSPVEALRDVSFELYEGEIFGLIGPNGAGKTTLTKVIATLVQPTSGSVTVKDFDSVRHEEQVRRQVGLATAEERSFYWRLTAGQNLQFFARLHGLSDQESRRRIKELLELFELESVSERRFGELSTGNKQRLAVARSLLSRPPVLLLDEPTRSLDPLAAARMRTFINSLSAASPPVSVLLTSHNLLEIEELCERIAVIHRGRIRALDKPSNLGGINRQTERVRITATGLQSNQARLALREIGEADITEDNNSVVITFSREANDDLLHLCLLALHGAGARIRGCESEKATLLDLLEDLDREEGDSLA
jgi:ABC-2 type transport system ATP-binding protein